MIFLREDTRLMDSFFIYVLCLSGCETGLRDRVGFNSRVSLGNNRNQWISKQDHDYPR